MAVGTRVLTTLGSSAGSLEADFLPLNKVNGLLWLATVACAVSKALACLAFVTFRSNSETSTAR